MSTILPSKPRIGHVVEDPVKRIADICIPTIIKRSHISRYGISYWFEKFHMLYFCMWKSVIYV